MNIIKNDKEIELVVDGRPYPSIIDKDTMFQIEKVHDKVILKELDEDNEFLFGGKYITLNESQWEEYKVYFTNL